MREKILNTITLVSSVAGFLLASTAIVFVVWAALFDEPLLENISVPEIMAKQNHTERTFADDISSGTITISEMSKEGFDVERPREYVKRAKVLELKIPGTDFSVRSAILIVQYIFHHKNKHIFGDVEQNGEYLQLTLRREGQPDFNTDQVAISDPAFAAKLIKQGAEGALQLAVPYVQAAAFFNQERRSVPERFPQTEKLIQLILHQGGPDAYFAHTLQGAVDSELAQFPAAIRECDIAKNLQPYRWAADACKGWAYLLKAESLRAPGMQSIPFNGKPDCLEADKALTIANTKHCTVGLFRVWADCKHVLGDDLKAGQLMRLTTVQNPLPDVCL